MDRDRGSGVSGQKRDRGMSKNIGGIPVIYPEEDSRCELCGAITECRPYGPNGEQICYDCGMKNPEQTKRMMNKVLFKQGNA